ncbi:MAG TPA: MGMT family protein [Acidimicrobiia bacterium]|nr:MGMT family protein [Acidimicrobiia bacterium]
MGEPTFAERVEDVIRALRPGEVVTYGEVAADAGRPGAARAVGHLLATRPGDLPWWRVVTASGRLVPGHEAEHTRRLAAEGVRLHDGRVRLGR